MPALRIGVLSPSEIAFRRFLPALRKCQAEFDYVGLATASPQEWGGPTAEAEAEASRAKALGLQAEHGGLLFDSYAELLESDVDCVYVPLPPALHYRWGRLGLEHGKHVLLEKPSTTAPADTSALVDLARANGLALHENYMFQYHSQLETIRQEIAQGTIGEVRLIQIQFGFPFRGVNDFRYNPALGGGALLDCGGYTIKLATMLLGDSARVTTSTLGSARGLPVDVYGHATLVNDAGLTAQVSFGMDNDYRCNLDVWGSQGRLFTDRVLTAPDGFEPTLTIRSASGDETRTLAADDSFRKSILAFRAAIDSAEARERAYAAMLTQSRLVDEVSAAAAPPRPPADRPAE